MSRTTNADRTLFMARVMSEAKMALQCSRPHKGDRSDAAQAWHSVYQTVCAAEDGLKQLVADEEQRRSR